jgi:hypothetical protein
VAVEGYHRQGPGTLQSVGIEHDSWRVARRANTQTADHSPKEDQQDGVLR